ncbi:hypothetical protein [Rubrivirga sp.]|uniref:hypothetical protein n=1 Tax=Rubrivirga sp. TaxID=1885344 RepID=UPI003C727CE8
MPAPLDSSLSLWARLRVRVANVLGRATETPLAETAPNESRQANAPDPEAVFSERQAADPYRPWTFRDDWKSGRLVGVSEAHPAPVVVLEVIAQMGTRLAGRVETALKTVPASGLDTALECVARRVTDGGRVEDVVLWSAPVADTAEVSGGRVVVPFSVPIPLDAVGASGLSPYPTTVLSPAETGTAAHRVLWRLVLEAEPGYRAAIEVPVFAAAADLEAAV